MTLRLYQIQATHDLKNKMIWDVCSLWFAQRSWDSCLLTLAGSKLVHRANQWQGSSCHSFVKQSLTRYDIHPCYKSSVERAHQEGPTAYDHSSRLCMSRFRLANQYHSTPYWAVLPVCNPHPCETYTLKITTPVHKTLHNMNTWALQWSICSKTGDFVHPQPSHCPLTGPLVDSGSPAEHRTW